MHFGLIFTHILHIMCDIRVNYLVLPFTLEYTLKTKSPASWT